MIVEELNALAAQYVDPQTAKAIVEEALRKLPAIVIQLATDEQRKLTPEPHTTASTRYETWHGADPQRTEKALLQLVLVEQQAFRAVYLDGLSLGQAAEQLAVPINTIKIRSQNALRSVGVLTRAAA
jgi:DNA-directed RNA polymerase specialized sigma24 family protein